MADIISVGGTESLTGSGANDNYFFNNVGIIATATIVDNGGQDTIYVTYGTNFAHGLPNGTSGNFINTGSELIFRARGDHDIIMPLKANGDSAIETFVWWSTSQAISETLTILTDINKATAGTDIIFAGTDEDDDIVVPVGVGSTDGYSEVYANAGNDRITLSATSLILAYGGYGNDTITGVGGFNDYFRGDSGNDLLRGAGGNDGIDGNDGRDRIFGDAGNDALNGGFGNDTIAGGSGKDTVTGGSGYDVFVFDQKSGTDRIVDWQDGIDRIDLVAFGIANFAALQVGISASGGNAVINLSSFGGSGNIVVESAAGQMNAGDFIFV